VILDSLVEVTGSVVNAVGAPSRGTVAAFGFTADAQPRHTSGVTAGACRPAKRATPLAAKGVQRR
jgi:hypothetical protein